MITLPGATLLLLVPLQPLIIPGERLIYDVSSARFGHMGQAEFAVSELDNGNIRLEFTFDARVLLFRASDRTVSELDAVNLRTVRYEKRERSPLGGRDESVVIDHGTSTWTQAGGSSQALASADPLDELSFIYLIRNMAMAPGEVSVLRRHFDGARNPIRLRSIAAQDVDIIEMRVPDGRQKGGESVLRFHLSRDATRVPVRIESSMPIAGRITMTLVRRR